MFKHIKSAYFVLSWINDFDIYKHIILFLFESMRFKSQSCLWIWSAGCSFAELA